MNCRQYDLIPNHLACINKDSLKIKFFNSKFKQFKILNQIFLKMDIQDLYSFIKFIIKNQIDLEKYITK